MSVVPESMATLGVPNPVMFVPFKLIALSGTTQYDSVPAGTSI